jgi:hypothetical protein
MINLSYLAQLLAMGCSAGPKEDKHRMEALACWRAGGAKKSADMELNGLRDLQLFRRYLNWKPPPSELHV